MSGSLDPRRARLGELLALRALEGLDDASASELRELRAAGLSDAGFEDVVAELHAAELEDALEPLPAALRARLEADADAFFERAAGPRSVTTGSRVLAWSGWLVAAGLLAYALLLGRGAAEQDPARAREEFVASAPDLLTLPWTVTEDPLVASAGVEGDVVWSDALDRGYLRLRGLPTNDPAREQYQLWIFDEARSAERPVDGGVFDVTGTGEVVVPIDAKLGVSHAFLFGVTVERPGGVVVSDREHLVLLAQS